jgi:hypothetical protein
MKKIMAITVILIALATLSAAFATLDYSGYSVANFMKVGGTDFVIGGAETGYLTIGPNGAIRIEGATTDAYVTTLAFVDPTAARTITFPNSSGTVALNPYGASIEFEGATADEYETTLAVTDPTADRTITLPDRTGIVRVATAMGTITAGATPSVDLSSASIFLDTPNDNQAQTITGTGQATIPGAYVTIKFVGSATNTEVITFGTGFKSTGTLTVGNATSNIYTVTFVSDGTTWLEVARTATQS